MIGRTYHAGLGSGPYRMLLVGLLAVAPTLLFLFVAESFLCLAGETTPIEEVVSAHGDASSPAAYLPALLGQQFSRFHLLRLERARPELLVVGSSRVMRFHREMFAPEISFYNCGRLVSSVSHLDAFIAALPADYTPRTVLLGVDSWWFSFDRQGNSAPMSLGGADDTKNWSAHVTAYRRLIHSFCQGQIRPRLLRHLWTADDGGIKRYGLLAWTTGGFCNDGSYRDLDESGYLLGGRRQSVLSPNPPRKIFADRPTVNPELLGRLVASLKVLSERGSTIIGFAPPYRSELQEAFANDPVQASYFADFRRTAADTFARHGWYFFDGSDPAALGLDDDCMDDGHHPRENYLVALLAAMSRDPEVRAALQVDSSVSQLLSHVDGTSARRSASNDGQLLEPNLQVKRAVTGAEPPSFFQEHVSN